MEISPKFNVYQILQKNLPNNELVHYLTPDKVEFSSEHEAEEYIKSSLDGATQFVILSVYK